MPSIALSTLLLLSACSTRLEIGAACEAGTAQIPYIDDDWRLCLLDPLCSWSCTGPPGCEGEAGFTWRVVQDYAAYIEYCGCDGATRSGTDTGDEPIVRYRWYGECEDPCVFVNIVGDHFEYREFGDLPFNPACTQCRDAMEIDGVCMTPDGFRVSADCCACSDSNFLDADGSCLSHPRIPIEISASCCL